MIITVAIVTFWRYPKRLWTMRRFFAMLSLVGKSSMLYGYGASLVVSNSYLHLRMSFLLAK